ncbi:hypothetical protein [Streptomyces californicus]|uniref:hypothetical protein n=1 Tax=Streptomyces californicus TaxID=67351 RepID=UPI00296E69F8|nr:hypothetical protein [Streptomyces californicus]MDW4917372.1 hypothetical protein [Streptomyces californicus]
MRPSRRPALKASEIPPQNLNLRQSEHQSIVCPDCDSWHPLYRKMIKTHHLDREVRAGRAPRCPGSAQLIDMDISVEQWGERMLAADSTATGRRSARQHYKPLAQPPTPIYRLADRGPQGTPTLYRLLPLLESARHAVDQHRTVCSLCTGGGRCETGRALEVRFAETQASCTIAREQLHRPERQQGGRAAAPTRRSEWAGVLHQVRQADQRRRTMPEGAAPAKVPEVPLDRLVPRQVADRPDEGPLTCERCGAAESSLADALDAGWCRITRRPHCGSCASRFPAWTRTPF